MYLSFELSGYVESKSCPELLKWAVASDVESRSMYRSYWCGVRFIYRITVPAHCTGACFHGVLMATCPLKTIRLFHPPVAMTTDLCMRYEQLPPVLTNQLVPSLPRDRSPPIRAQDLTTWPRNDPILAGRFDLTIALNMMVAGVVMNCTFNT